MSKFTDTIKDRSGKVWQAVKPYGYYIVSLLLVGVIAITTYSLVHKDKDTNTNQPSINEQELNPRIGDALAPDVNPEAQQNANTNNPQVATNYVAPKTGIDDSEPVEYWSDRWHFAATLPPHTAVNEMSDGVSFASAEKTYYTVLISPAGSETLQSIALQLNASNAKNIYLSENQIDFVIDNQQGKVIIQNGFVYYVIGNQYLETFHTK